MTDRTCFLIAPIGAEGSEVRERSDLLLNFVIRPTMESCRYKLTRADQINAPGPITAQIIRRVIEAEVVIADISGLNPNVMYELGIRHSVAKPVIQLADKREAIPFDIANIRTIMYDLSNATNI